MKPPCVGDEYRRLIWAKKDRKTADVVESQVEGDITVVVGDMVLESKSATDQTLTIGGRRVNAYSVNIEVRAGLPATAVIEWYPEIGFFAKDA